MPRFGESDVEPIAYRTNAKGHTRPDPPLDHHTEELLAELSDLSRRGGEAGADAIA
jgi:hypothetical protein